MLFSSGRPAIYLLISFFASISLVNAAQGINCRGSWFCAGNKGMIDTFVKHQSDIHDNDIYHSGSHIMCLQMGGLESTNRNGFCLFLQGLTNSSSITGPAGNTTLGIKGSTVKIMLQKLMAHKCSGCGSIPVDWETNNPANGLLTVNYVTNLRECTGHCEPDIAANDVVNNPFAIAASSAASASAQALQTPGPSSAYASMRAGTLASDIAPLVASILAIPAVAAAKDGGAKVPPTTMETRIIPELPIATSTLALVDPGVPVAS